MGPLGEFYEFTIGAPGGAWPMGSLACVVAVPRSWMLLDLS